MRNLSGPTLAAVTGLVALACSAPAPEDTSQADLAAFEQMREREMAAFSAGDMEALRVDESGKCQGKEHEQQQDASCHGRDPGLDSH